LVIVASHARNSPADVPSKADWMALVTMSAVTSSTCSRGTFMLTRRSMFGQWP
jgi:hypothetical protein